MSLLGNQSVLNLNNSWGTFLNGTSAAGAYVGNLRQNFEKENVWFGSAFLGVSQNQSVPSGYNLGSAIQLAIKNGGIASNQRIRGIGVLSASALEVKLSQSSISASGTVTADLQSFIPVAASVTGTGLVSASLRAVSRMTSSINGAGSISASLKASVPMEVVITATGSLAPGLSGVGRLEAEITSVTALSPQGLAEALLENNDIETGYNLKEALRLILASVAGKLSGAETTTITIRNVPDSKNRIVATVDSNGNRTAVTYDVGD